MREREGVHGANEVDLEGVREEEGGEVDEPLVMLKKGLIDHDSILVLQSPIPRRVKSSAECDIVALTIQPSLRLSTYHPWRRDRGRRE